jgi:uncharacterized delta-60 repeat protein
MKKFTIILLSLVVFPIAVQGYIEGWVYRYNGAGYDEDVAFSVAQGQDGNVYAAGRCTEIGSVNFAVISLSTEGDTNWIFGYHCGEWFDGAALSIVNGDDGNVYAAGYGTGAGTSDDLLVVSLTAEGDTNWTCRYNGPANGDEGARSIACGPDGSICAAGYTTGIGTSWDFLVISLTAAGDTNWTFQYDGGAGGMDRATSVACGEDGSVYVAGYSEGVGTHWDLTVISLDAEGDTNWVYRYDGSASSADAAFDLVCGFDGNVYAAGYSQDDTQEFTVVSLDPSGTENWVYTYGEPGDSDIANAIECGDDGNIYAAGYGGNQTDSRDFVVVSLTAAGEENWVYRYDGPAGLDDKAKAVVYGDDGNVYAAGYASNFLTSRDFTVVSLDSHGSENWVYGYHASESSHWDEAYAIIYGQDGNVYAAGYSIQSIGAGVWDFTVIGLLKGIKSEEDEFARDALSDVRIRPNPFSNRTSISLGEMKKSEDIALTLYNSAGVSIRSLNPSIEGNSGGLVTWNGKDDEGNEVPGGVYFLRVSLGDSFETRRVLLIR